MTFNPEKRLDRDPWPPFWEQRRQADECMHEWEIHVTPNGSHGKPETVVRCRFSDCHTPRCGHSEEADPCMERRHHGGVHIRQSGKFDPVGGHLLAEDDAQ